MAFGLILPGENSQKDPLDALRGAFWKAQFEAKMAEIHAAEAQGKLREIIERMKAECESKELIFGKENEVICEAPKGARPGK